MSGLNPPLISRLRRAGATVLGPLLVPVLLRLAVGRWPPEAQRAGFLHGFARQSLKMPPLLRGLLAIPLGRDMLRQAATYAWHWQRGSLDAAGPPDLGGNIYTAWTGPALGFLHIEKCGGIAVTRWLSQKFHPEQINPDRNRDLPPHLLYRAPPAMPEDTGRYPLIWGHYDVPSLRRIDPARFIFTMLREPRARVVSLYHFWRSVDPTQFDAELGFSVALAHRLSLEAFLEWEDPMLRDLIDNVYTRRLTGLYATGAAADPLRAAPEAALHKALGVLETLGFVGITERLEDSVAGLAARLGIAAPDGGLRANVTAENAADPSGWFRAIAPVARTPAAEAALHRLTALDQVLYAHALAGFAGDPAIAAQ